MALGIAASFQTVIVGLPSCKDGNLQLRKFFVACNHLGLFCKALNGFRLISVPSQFEISINISFIRLLAPRHRPVYQVYANVALEMASVEDSLRTVLL
jgi:hypothetical protein